MYRSLASSIYARRKLKSTSSQTLFSAITGGTDSSSLHVKRKKVNNISMQYLIILLKLCFSQRQKARLPSCLLFIVHKLIPFLKSIEIRESCYYFNNILSWNIRRNWVFRIRSGVFMNRSDCPVRCCE